MIDTNVWLDLLLFEEPSVRRLERLLAETGVCLASAAMRDELHAVLQRERFGLDAAARERALARFDDCVTRVDEAPDCRLACSDADDRKFLDAAVANRADWLVSRDKALLRTRRHAWRRFALRVGTPAALDAWIDASDRRTESTESTENPGSAASTGSAASATGDRAGGAR